MSRLQVLEFVKGGNAFCSLVKFFCSIPDLIESINSLDPGLDSSVRPNFFPKTDQFSQSTFQGMHDALQELPILGLRYGRC